MPGTFTQIIIHSVFAVQGRVCLIRDDWEGELHRYITGVIKRKEQKLLAIGGMPDHLHFVIGMKPTCCLSDLVREIKKSSTTFINERGFVRGRFHWQEGYGAFSHSKASLDTVVRYVLNQKEHHRRHTFREEYRILLEEYGIEYNDEYLFE
jgi:putative transposase